MKKKDNINTKEYWENIYEGGNNESDKDFLKADLFSTAIINGKSVLDLGCGSGYFLEAVLERRPYCQLTGLDYSEKAVKRLPEPIRGIVGDVTDTGLEDESFDYVISFETMEHLDEPEKLVKEMARLTRYAAYLTTPYLDHIPSDQHTQEFDFPEVEAMFKRYFPYVYVFPFASGRYTKWQTGAVQNPPGNFDTICVIASKTKIQ